MMKLLRNALSVIGLISLAGLLIFAVQDAPSDENLEKKIINLVVKQQRSYYTEKNFIIDATISIFSPEGLKWIGGIYYYGQSGSFIILKQRLHERICKCMK